MPITLPFPIPAKPTNMTGWNERSKCARDPRPDRWVDLPPVRIRGKNNPAYDEHLDDLREFCGDCPVRAHCLWEALESNTRGVNAGTDEYERADLRETLGIPAAPMDPEPENEEDARLLEQRFSALRLARKGLSNKEIAHALDVSPMTVSRLTASDDAPAERRTNIKPKHETTGELSPL